MHHKYTLKWKEVADNMAGMILLPLLHIKHMQQRHNYQISNIRNIINNNSNIRRAGHSKDNHDQAAVRLLEVVSMVTMYPLQWGQNRVGGCLPILTLFPYILNTLTSLAQVRLRYRR